MPDPSSPAKPLSQDKFRGVLTPLTTPFEGDAESFCGPSLRRNILALSKTGLRGFLILGSTGEFPALDTDEKLEILEVAASSIPGTMSWLFGITAESTRGAIRLGKEAHRAGADAALLGIPTYFGKLIDEDMLEAFFRDVAEAIEIPLLLYSVPAFTNRALSESLVAKLSTHPNIRGMKESGDRPERHRATIEALDGKRDFAWITGHAPSYSKAVRPSSQGGLAYCGGILAVSNVVPEIAVELDRALHAGDSQIADDRQQKLDDVVGILKAVGLPGIKRLLDARGLIGGPVRRPLQDPGSAWVEDALRQLAFIAELDPLGVLT